MNLSRSIRRTSVFSVPLIVSCLAACGPTAEPEPELVVIDPDEPSTCPGSDEVLLHDVDVNGGVTLPAGCYRVPEVLNVAQGTLTIEAGATLIFEQGAGIHVSSDGRLAALGNEKLDVVLTGAEGLPGFWKGVYFDSSMSADNLLEQVLIEFAGSSAWTGSETHGGGLFVNGQSSVTVKSSTLRDNGISGLALDLSSPAGSVQVMGTHFERNQVAAFSNTDAASSFAADNVFVDNEVQAVEMEARSFEPLAVDTTWQALSVPYRLQGVLSVTSALTLEPGAQLQFAGDSGLEFTGQGSLQALGTEQAPITFSGVSAMRGQWRGLGFMSDTASRLEFARVQDAGGGQWNGFG